MPDPFVALVIGLLFTAGGALVFWPDAGLFGRWHRARRVTQRVLSEDALKHIHQARKDSTRLAKHRRRARNQP
jgi:hypothetical protein